MKTVVLQVVALCVIGVGYGLFSLLRSDKLSNSEIEVVQETTNTLGYFTQNVKRADNNRILQQIENRVKLSGNTLFYRNWLEKAHLVRNLTNDQMKMFNQLREEAIKSANGYAENGKDVKNTMNVVNLKKEQVLFFVKSLQDFADSLSKISETTLTSPIQVPGKEETSLAGFANFYFGSKPLPVYLLNISYLQSQIASLEQEALIAIGLNTNYIDLLFKDLIPVVEPLSDRVKVGEEYIAQISIAAVKTDIRPLLFIEGNTMPVENGIGKVSYTPNIPLSSFKGDEVRLLFNADMSLATKYGNNSYSNTGRVVIKK